MVLLNTEDHTDALSDVSDTSYTSDLDDTPQSLMLDLSNRSPLSANNITFIHFNVDSILAENRIDELTLVCQTLSVDCLVISESHLDDTIPLSLIRSVRISRHPRNPVYVCLTPFPDSKPYIPSLPNQP